MVFSSIAAQAESGLIFEADFTKSLNAKHAEGDPTAHTGTAQLTKEGGMFGKDADPSLYQTVIFSREANINPDAGTLEFWFRPADDDAEAPVRYLFDLPTSVQNEAGNLQRFVIAISGTGQERTLNVFPGNQGPNAVIAVPVSWDTKKWHHVALTWDGSTVRLFLDGKEVADKPTGGGLFDGDSDLKTAIGQIFGIGGLTDAAIANSANAEITGFKIFDHPVYERDFQPKRP